MITVIILLLVAGLYLLSGLFFSIAFVWKGVSRIDESAKDSSWGFRLIIIPGTIIFWPLLLRKWMVSHKITKL